MTAKTQVNRTPLYIALAMAIVLVLGVLIGAKLVYSKAAHQPIAMAALDTPDATSPECSALIDALPRELLGHDRATIADPAPEGAAAWSSNSTERVTLRCGVTLPLQYTSLSALTSAEGVDWLQVIDATPGSTMQTWYSIGTFPTIAVTADAESMKNRPSPVVGLASALGTLKEAELKPNPVPLSGLESPNSADQQCTALLQALPASPAEGYAQAQLDLPGTMAWTKQGHEPIIVRCGVKDPENYQAGARLNQVDDIPWFEDTKLANGTTAGTYFAMGRSVNVVMSMPSDAGNAAITAVTKAVSANTKAS